MFSFILENMLNGLRTQCKKALKKIWRETPPKLSEIPQFYPTVWYYQTEQS